MTTKINALGTTQSSFEIGKGSTLTTSGSNLDISSPPGGAITLNGVGFNPFVYNVRTETANYTLSMNDVYVRMNSSTTTTVTIPNNSSVSFPIGTTITVTRAGTGLVNFDTAVGVTMNKGSGYASTIRAQWSNVTVIKVDTNTWDSIGDWDYSA